MGASQREIESGAFIDGGLDPDTATVSRDDPLYRCKADPGAFKLGIRVQSLKRCKKFVGVGHIESRAVVPDVEHDLVILVFLPDHDPGLGLFCRVLPGVSEQVLQDNRD